MNRLALCLALALPVDVAASPAPAFQAKVAHLRGTVKALASKKLEGRLVGSPGELAAATLVEKAFKRARLKAPLQNMLRPFPVGVCYEARLLSDARTWGARPTRGQACDQVASRNVLGAIPGEAGQGAVLVGAHIDHLGKAKDAQGKTLIFRGAEDNASGVAALLEVARLLGGRRDKPRRTIYFVGFGGEEEGMLGSKAFVKSDLPALEKVGLMVNLDMVGRAVGAGQFYAPFLPQNTVGTVGTEDRPGLKALVDAACKAHGLSPQSGRDVLGAGPGIWKRTYGRGDGFSFERAHIPHVFFGDAEPAEYHTADDVPENIDFSRLQVRTEMIADLVWSAATQVEPLPAFTALPLPGG